MIGKNNTYLVMQAFFDRPTHRFQLRELSRETGISLPSVREHVRALERQGLVNRVDEGVYGSFVASAEDSMYRAYKVCDMVTRIHESGLTGFLEKELSFPGALVLFGSCSEGTDTEASDIDILVVGGEKKLSMKPFERKLRRRISLHFMDKKELSNAGKNSPEFMNNIMNGIVLYGYLKVF